jgi:hypothetical protein
MPDLSTDTVIVLGAAFAVQRLIEIFDRPLSWCLPDARRKRFWTAIIASGLGIGIAAAAGLSLIGSAPDWSPLRLWTGYVVTGLAIGAGTEGVNSVLKFVNYKKEAKRSRVQRRPKSGP